MRVQCGRLPYHRPTLLFLACGVNRTQWPFDRPQYLLRNVAVGGVLGGMVADHQLPASMEVDWVRVYRRL